MLVLVRVRVLVTVIDALAVASFDSTKSILQNILTDTVNRFGHLGQHAYDSMQQHFTLRPHTQATN